MSVGLAMEWAENQQANAAQDSLFGDIVAATPPPLVEVAEWPLKERLALEKSALGFYISGHPFDADRDSLTGLNPRPLKEVRPQPGQQLLAGIVASVRTQMTRRGKMCFVTLDDRTAQVEVAVFNETYEASRSFIKEDELLIVTGRASDDQYSGGMRVTADELMSLDAALTRFATGLKLSMQSGAELKARPLVDLLAIHREGKHVGCPVTVSYRNASATCDLALGSAWCLRLSSELFSALEAFGQVEVKYAVVLKSGRERERAVA
jgi:DNA polymerase III subunit alpha